MLKHFILCSGLAICLTACGGGGGGGGGKTNPPVQETSSAPLSSSASSAATSSSSSSSSSSSISSINPCNNTSGVIFSECFNTNYGSIIGAQYLPTYIEYTESSASQQVQWSIADTSSTHNKALDVTFSDNNRQGQIFIGQPGQNPSGQDLTQFQTGSLQFDVRILNFGGTYDAAAGGSVFSVRMDCIWPCSSHEVQVVVPTLETWTHVEISITDFIASGLDISKISASLVFVPRGQQGGLHFQLDNIQLSKGGPVVAGPKVIFKEDFNTQTIPQWQFTKVAGNTVTSTTTAYGFGAFIGLGWSSANDVVRFETTLDKTIDITNKKASFQFECWKNSNMNFSFQMMSTDTNGVTETTEPNYAMTLSADKWYKVYADLGGVFDGNFDAKHIKKVGLQLNYLGGGQGSTYCQVDTIRITE